MAAERFATFSGEHFGLVGLFLLGAVGVVLFGRSRRGSERGRAFSRGYAVVVVCVTVPSQVFQLTPGDFDIDTSLPIQLCDLAWMTAVWGLWTHRPVPVALTYFWGLTLTVQGIITPSLGQAFPHPRYFAFWAMHFLVVWAALYLTVGLGLGPRWSQYRVAVAVTAVWAALVFAVNAILDVNYGYLNRKPESASLLDALGPWPVYVLASLAILLAGWALMTWPWVYVDHRRDRRAASAG